MSRAAGLPEPPQADKAVRSTAATQRRVDRIRVPFTSHAQHPSGDRAGAWYSGPDQPGPSSEEGRTSTRGLHELVHHLVERRGDGRVSVARGGCGPSRPGRDRRAISRARRGRVGRARRDGSSPARRCPACGTPTGAPTPPRRPSIRRRPRRRGGSNPRGASASPGERANTSRSAAGAWGDYAETRAVKVANSAAASTYSGRNASADPVASAWSSAR